MKKLGLLAALAALMVGCTGADVDPTSPEAAAPHFTADPAAQNLASTGGGTTAPAFPESTPPSNKPSTTATDYWHESRENTKPYEKEGHGEAKHEEHEAEKPEGE